MKSIKRKALVIVTAGMLVAGSMSTAVMAHGNGHGAVWCTQENCTEVHCDNKVCTSENCTNDDCEKHTLCDKGLLCQNTAVCEDCGETYCHDHKDDQHVSHEKSHSQGYGKSHHTETKKSNQGKHHTGHHGSRI